MGGALTEEHCIGIYHDAREYSLAIRIGLFLHRLCQPGEGKFVAHGQCLEQLLHHLFGNSPDVQPLDEADDLLQLVATLLQQRRLCRDRHDERRVQVGLRRRRNGFDGFLRVTSGAQANVQAPRGEVALGGVQRGHHADLRLAQRHLLLPQRLLVARQCRQRRQHLALLQTRLVLLGLYASAPPPSPASAAAVPCAIPGASRARTSPAAATAPKRRLPAPDDFTLLTGRPPSRAVPAPSRSPHDRSFLLQGL